MGTTNGLTFYNTAGVQGMAPRVNREAVANLYHEHPEQFVHTGTPENFFTSFVNNRRDIKQAVTSGYAQATIRVSSRFTLLGGIRMEKTDTSTKVFDPYTRAQVLAAGYTVNAAGTNGGRALTIPGLIYQFMSQPRVTRSAAYQNYFPSVSGKFYITPDFEFQLGFNNLFVFEKPLAGKDPL